MPTSPRRIAPYPTRDGDEATHGRDLGLVDASDEKILAHAGDRGFVIISQDSDFTNLLAYRGAASPSLVLLRDVQEVAAADIANLIVLNLPQIREALAEGVVASFASDRIRLRHLPIG